MLKRSFAALLGVLLMIGACLGCGPQGDISSGVAERDFPVTVNEVTIQDEPKGVVVLSPNLAEVILALGYEMQLCGKGAACTQEDLSVLPDMTMDDPQSILGVGADLVLTEQSPTEECLERILNSFSFSHLSQARLFLAGIRLSEQAVSLQL